MVSICCQGFSFRRQLQGLDPQSSVQKPGTNKNLIDLINSLLIQDAEKALAVILELVERELPKLRNNSGEQASTAMDAPAGGLPAKVADDREASAAAAAAAGVAASLEDGLVDAVKPQAATLGPSTLSPLDPSANTADEAPAVGGASPTDGPRRFTSPSRSLSLVSAPAARSAPDRQEVPWLAAASQWSLPVYKEGDCGLGTIAEARRFTMPSAENDATAGSLPPSSRCVAAPLPAAAHVNAELAGLVYDLVHLSHEELVVCKEGPLPGSSSGLGSKQVREAALQRLRLKPVEAQRHVGLLEAAKKQLNRLVGVATL